MNQYLDKIRIARLSAVMSSVFLITLAFTINMQAQTSGAPLRTWVSATTGTNSNPCTRTAPCRRRSRFDPGVPTTDDQDIIHRALLCRDLRRRQRRSTWNITCRRRSARRARRASARSDRRRSGNRAPSLPASNARRRSADRRNASQRPSRPGRRR